MADGFIGANSEGTSASMPSDAKEHFDYCLSLGGVMILFGEVGSGKTTSMRWTLSHYHPSEQKQVNVVANTGSMLEFYKQLAWGP